MANPFPFVSGSVLLASELNGIGEYAAFTPTFTNFTLGNGSLSFRFGRVQKFIQVEGEIFFGSTTSVSGAATFTLPVARRNTTFQNMGGLLLSESGVGVRVGFLQFISGTARFTSLAVSGSVINSLVISASSPFTWGTNDRIDINFTYEAA